MSSVTNALGRSVFVDPSDRRGRHLLDHGADANPHSMTMWRDLLLVKPWDLVIDVGANYGEMLLGAQLPSEAAVVAYEPNALIYPYLSHSVQESGLPIQVRSAAISDTVGQSILMLDHNWSGTSHLIDTNPSVSGHTESSQTCATTTLTEEFMGTPYRSACIKVDIEGHEMSAIQGARQWLETLDDYALLVEILHLPIEQVRRLSNEWCMYMRHLRTGQLIRITAADDDLQALLDSSTLYPQDAILTLQPLYGARNAQQEERQTMWNLITTLDGEIDQIREKLHYRDQRLDEIFASRSWRLTAALRRIKGS